MLLFRIAKPLAVTVVPNQYSPRQGTTHPALRTRKSSAEEATMKPRILAAFTTIALFAVLAVPVRLATQEQQRSQSNASHPRYAVTFLGTLGGTFSQPFGLNNKGEVNGIANLPGDLNHHAFL
jgi:hypothetical protein